MQWMPNLYWLDVDRLWILLILIARLAHTGRYGLIDDSFKKDTEWKLQLCFTILKKNSTEPYFVKEYKYLNILIIKVNS